MSAFSLCFKSRVIQATPESTTAVVSIRAWARPLLPLIVWASRRRWRLFQRGRSVHLHPAELFGFPEPARTGKNVICLSWGTSPLYIWVSYDPEKDKEVG